MADCTDNRTGYTDLHAHIIPGVDDGAENMETAIAMLERAYDEGIRNMVATPHFGIRNTSYDSSVAERNFSLLKEHMSELHPDMNLYMGNELYYGPGVFSGLKEGYAKALAGSRYALVEFPFVTDFEEMYHGVRKFLMKGYVPVIAHVERYSRYIGKLPRLEELVNQGALVQMNCDAVTAEHERGFFGKRSWTVRAVRAGLVHLISSDCHDLVSRPPRMRKAAECLEEIVGSEKAREILYENPGRIISDAADE